MVAAAEVAEGGLGLQTIKSICDMDRSPGDDSSVCVDSTEETLCEARCETYQQWLPA